jgi:hypothetical protein
MDLLQVIDSKIASVRKELETLLAARKLLSRTDAGGDAPFPRPQGRMSAKGRAAIAKAQKARWAKVKAAKKAK